MARITVVLFCFFFSLLSHQTMSQPTHMDTFCNPNANFIQTSLYETNRNIVLSTLSITSSLVPYSNISIGLFPDTVHGMFLCRGDIDTTACSSCVQTATIEIATNCTLNKEAFIYYQECMVRYSDFSFFSDLEIRPNIVQFSIRPAPNSNRFNQTITDKFNQLILDVSPSTPIPYFVQDQETVTQLEGSYELESMVQCSPGLDRLNCTVCLRLAFVRISTCCGLPSSSRIFTPKCLLRYRTTVLTSPPSPSSLLPPPPLFPPSPPSSSLPPPSLFPPPPPSSSLPPPSLFPPPPPSSSLPPPSRVSSPPIFPPSPPSPPQLPTQPPPPPLVFTQPQNFPSPSGSFSINVINGNEIFGRIVVTMIALVFALADM